MSGHVDSVWISERASAPMVRVQGVRAVPGGLEGDRYLTGEGYYTPFDVCEVTFIGGEDLDAIRETAGVDLSDGGHRRNVVLRGVDLSDGGHRRNVVLRGVDLDDLLESRFRVGGATFEGTRRRPPCKHVEEVAGEAGVMQALRGKGGICADVVGAGEVAVGDAVEVLEDLSFDGEGLAEAMRSRHE